MIKVLNEADYIKGKKYQSKNGDFKFEVLNVSDDSIKIKDLEDNSEYNVELSALELCNPTEI